MDTFSVVALVALAVWLVWNWRYRVRLARSNGRLRRIVERLEWERPGYHPHPTERS